MPGWGLYSVFVFLLGLLVQHLKSGDVSLRDARPGDVRQSYRWKVSKKLFQSKIRYRITVSLGFQTLFLLTYSPKNNKFHFSNNYRIGGLRKVSSKLTILRNLVDHTPRGKIFKNVPKLSNQGCNRSTKCQFQTQGIWAKLGP